MAFPPVIPMTTAMREARERRCGCEPEQCRPYHEWYRGDTQLLPFQVVGRASGVQLDVSGWTFRFTAKFALPNPDAQAAFRADNVAGGIGGVTLVAPTQGQCLVTIAPSATLGWGDGPIDVEYDVQSTDVSGVIKTIEVGTITVRPHATKSIGS